MSSVTWYLVVAGGLVGIGLTRMLTARQPLTAILALNVAGVGTLLAIVALAARAPVPDPVPHALALTAIVITVAFTAVGLMLVRRLEQRGEDDDQ